MQAQQIARGLPWVSSVQFPEREVTSSGDSWAHNPTTKGGVLMGFGFSLLWTFVRMSFPVAKTLPWPSVSPQCHLLWEAPVVTMMSASLSESYTLSPLINAVFPLDFPLRAGIIFNLCVQQLFWHQLSIKLSWRKEWSRKGRKKRRITERGMCGWGWSAHIILVNYMYICMEG